MENKMNKNAWLNISVGTLVGFILSLIVLALFGYNFNKLEPIVKTAYYTILSSSAIAAVIYYRRMAKKNIKDEEWNTKYLAFTQINEYIKELEKQRTILDRITVRQKMIKNDNNQYISFSDRLQTKEPIKETEVHEWVCLKKQGQIVPNGTSDKCATSVHGTSVVRALISIINTYELIASGITQEIFNEKLVLNVMDESILKNYEMMEKYIIHRRKDHDNPTFASEWEKLCIKIKKERECK